MLFTAASHKPPKCGVHSGMNFHVIFCMAQNSEMIPCVWKKAINSFSSRIAPTKFVPWSLHIKEGFPLRTMNRCRAAMKVSVVRSDTNSE